MLIKIFLKGLTPIAKNLIVARKSFLCLCIPFGHIRILADIKLNALKEKEKTQNMLKNNYSSNNYDNCNRTILVAIVTHEGLLTRGSVVSCATMLQAGRSRVRFPMRSLDFSTYLFLPAILWPRGRLSL
jgi:hypothetical protein